MSKARILVFGTGSAFRDLLAVLPADIAIVALLDNDASRHGTRVEGFEVVDPRRALEIEHDLIVITPRDGDGIRAQLIALGIPEQKIACYSPAYSRALTDHVNRDIDRLNERLGLGLHRVALSAQPVWPVGAGDTQACEDDYGRKMTLRLAAKRMQAQGIPGAIAELGVHRGELAAFLNALCPERPLYLFDTFQGFAAQDLAQESGAPVLARAGEFGDTSVELVRKRLPHPERAVFRVGFFPETAAGVEGPFALVSLDVDLYKPTLEGLKFFRPRLSSGGMVFVHDYHNQRFPGVRRAVDEYAASARAAVVPLPDLSGSVVLVG